MKLEETKKLQDVLKSDLNETSRGGHKSEEQKITLQNIKLITRSKWFSEFFNCIWS